MKRFSFFLLFSAGISLIACTSNNQSGNPAGEDSLRNDGNNDTTALFYPITQYLEGQIAYVDSTPLAIERHIYINNRRTDSAIIDRATFKNIAADFLYPDLNDNRLKRLYKETKFHDLTINTLTFSYNATDPKQELQQKDILLDPETQRVSNVMFRKVQHHGDTTITINGLWKPNLNFQLNYIIEPGNGPIQTRQIKLIWDRSMASTED